MIWGTEMCFNPDSKIATPYIDKLAAEGMCSEMPTPGPLCHMSRYGLLTGRYPFRTDVTDGLQTIDKGGQMTILALEVPGLLHRHGGQVAFGLRGSGLKILFQAVQ